MAKVLYLSANPKDEQNSLSLSVARHFITEYKANNPDDKVQEINLYTDEFQVVDKDVVNGWEKLWAGQPSEALSGVEKEKVSKVDAVVDNFISADKYIIANPLWNLSIPPMLKAYIDSIVIAGKTFKFTEYGPVGILKNKKLLHIQASGGIYVSKNSPVDHSNKYIKDIFGFIGVDQFEAIMIEGVHMFPEKIQEIKQMAMDQAKELARSF